MEQPPALNYFQGNAKWPLVEQEIITHTHTQPCYPLFNSDHLNVLGSKDRAGSLLFHRLRVTSPAKGLLPAVNHHPSAVAGAPKNQ